MGTRAVVETLVRVNVNERGSAMKAPQDDQENLTESLVNDRFQMIKPALLAQTKMGLSTGKSPHSAKALIPSEQNLKANAAKHICFEMAIPLSSLTKRELKQRQRGSGRKRNQQFPESADVNLGCSATPDVVGSSDVSAPESSYAADEDQKSSSDSERGGRDDMAYDAAQGRHEEFDVEGSNFTTHTRAAYEGGAIVEGDAPNALAEKDMQPEIELSPSKGCEAHNGHLAPIRDMMDDNALSIPDVIDANLALVNKLLNDIKASRDGDPYLNRK